MSLYRWLIAVPIAAAGILGRDPDLLTAEMSSEGRRLNNLVIELLHIEGVKIAKAQSLRFINPRDGWVFLRSKARIGANGLLTVTLESEPDNPISIHRAEIPETQEAFRFLPKGEHRLIVRIEGEASLREIVVRAVPEILFAKFGYNPWIKGFGPYDWQFLWKHLLPSVTTIVGTGSEEHIPYIERWKSIGRRWIVECGVPGLEARGERPTLTVDEAYQHWARNPGFQNPSLDGVIADEFLSDRANYPSWMGAIKRLSSDFPGKLFYPYLGGADWLHRTEYGKKFVETIIGQGFKMVWERYLPEQPTQQDAEALIRKDLIQAMEEWKKDLPDLPRHLIVCLGTFSAFPLTLSRNPDVDMKVYLDMQMHALATDPVFRDLYGIMGWTSGYMDEEMIRWLGLLYRHYAIEGEQTLLSEKYGFRYRTSHLLNPDFDQGLEGWEITPAEEGTIASKHLDGYGWIQGRWPRSRHGDDFLWMKRSQKRPNRISQDIADLIPGRPYSLKCITADYQGIVQKKTEKELHAIRIGIEGAEIVRSFQEPIPTCTVQGYWLNFYWLVFRAKSHIARLSISDWAKEDEPGGPLGQELMLNFVEVQPYLEEGGKMEVLGRMPSPLLKLPTGSIRPKGWLETQLRLMADGLLGHLMEISPWCRFEGNAWANPEGEGHSHWEELPYWLRGLTSLAYILKDERLIKEARRWIDPILASQTPDGYFGPRENWRNRDLWPNMIALYALRAHYEATGDERVIPFMIRFFRWLMRVPSEDLLPVTRGGGWQNWRGGDLLDSILWLYDRTGEPWLLDLARTVHEHTADWSGGIPSWHGVNICQGFREPAQFYLVSKDTRHLLATVRNYEMVMEIYGQMPGGMFAADENCRPGYTGPQQAAETCSMAEFIHSHGMLMRITGDGIWADRCEEIAFNSFPAAFTPDYRALHYLTAPNMVQLDRGNKSPFLQNAGKMLSYDPFDYRCCQHNHGLGWTSFVENLWMGSLPNGLVAVSYAPCEVRALIGGRNIQLVVDTDYPFGESVKIHIVGLEEPMSFPLALRIPSWCEGASLAINGSVERVVPPPNSFVLIERSWRDGDLIALKLPMRLQLKVWEKQGNAISVRYGALWFSLKIGESWERYGGTDEFPAYELFPTTPWNYGLIVDLHDPEGSFEILRKPKPLPSQPFTPENAPIELRAKGKLIPEWTLVGGIVGPLKESPLDSDRPTESISLIPMGCARLRISVFPRVVDEDRR